MSDLKLYNRTQQNRIERNRIEQNRKLSCKHTIFRLFTHFSLTSPYHISPPVNDEMQRSAKRYDALLYGANTRRKKNKILNKVMEFCVAKKKKRKTKKELKLKQDFEFVKNYCIYRETCWQAVDGVFDLMLDGLLPAWAACCVGQQRMPKCKRWWTSGGMLGHLLLHIQTYLTNKQQ